MICRAELEQIKQNKFKRTFKYFQNVYFLEIIKWEFSCNDKTNLEII